MIHRPQFAYPTPEGCRDEDFVYHFDGSNVPALNQDISGKTIENIPLALQRDAPFYWRGWKLGPIRNVQDLEESGVNIQYLPPDINVKLRDCYENQLQANWVPATEFCFPMNPLTFNSSLLTGPPVPLEPEIYCPPGGVIWLGLRAGVLHTPVVLPFVDDFLVAISLYGVKRFKECNS